MAADSSAFAQVAMREDYSQKICRMESEKTM